MAVNIPTRTDLQRDLDGATDTIRDELALLLVDRIRSQAASLIAGTDVGMLIPIKFSALAVTNAVALFEATGNYTLSTRSAGGERRLYIVLL